MKERYLLVVLILLVFFISGCEEPLFSKKVDIREIFGVDQSKYETLTGTLELIIVDDFENDISEDIYYLNVEGKSYELVDDGSFVKYPKAEVVVTGLIKDNRIIVDSIQKNPSKTTVEPWPKTLGEQKYIGVYLYPTEEPNPLFEEYSGGASEILNDFVLNKSYGLAGFSLFHEDFYVFNYLPVVCGTYSDYNEQFNYALEELDPFVNFREYDGIIIFYPIQELCGGDVAGGIGSLGKRNVLTDDGEVNLYKMWIYTDIEIWPWSLHNLMRHEITHNFGMPHQRVLICGDYPNRKPLDASCIGFGDDRYTPFISQGGDFSVRDKHIWLGWIDENNVIEATNGEFFVSPMNVDVHGTEYVQGIKIPIEGDLEGILMDGSSIQSDSNPLTHYYLEYWNENLPLSYLYDVDDGAFQSEDFYGLNATNITEAVFLRLGRDSIYAEGGYISNTRTYMTSNHPNACVYIEGQEPCEDQIFAPAVFAYILEGESYYDKFNRMSITLVEARDDGAVVDIDDYYSCGDTIIDEPNSFGVVEECDDGNRINTDICTNECKWATAHDGICWEGRERCAECCDLEGNCFQCDDCVGYSGSIADCDEDEICTGFNPTNLDNSPRCTRSCSSNFLAGCFYLECPQEYQEITGYEADMSDPLATACYDLDPNQQYHEETWRCCELIN